MSRVYAAIPVLTPDQVDRFWSKVDKNGPIPPHRPQLGPYWVWTAGKGSYGYGAFFAGGRSRAAHRIAWALANGHMPWGLFACHHCDNPPCCNPAHLFAGTPADNAHDRATKKRSAYGERSGSVLHPERRARGDRNGSHTHPERWARGEAAGKARLKSDNVQEMRRLADDGMSQRAIARRFGVSKSAVTSVVSRRTWAHLV